MKPLGWALAALALVAVGWGAKTLQVRARDAESARQRVADSVRVAAQLDSITAKSAADSVRLAREVDSARLVVSRLTARAAQLERRAAAHATADAEQEAQLAAAQTAADSLPVVVSQRDDARAAYSLQVEATDSLRESIAAHERVDSLTREDWRRREQLWGEREGVLVAFNTKLQADLAAANRARGFRVSWKVGTVVGVVAGAVGAVVVCKATGC